MDYDTFAAQFPSDAFLSKHCISLGTFKRRYMLSFFVNGFLGVGMSDVGMAQLSRSGALGSLFGRPFIIPWRFDARPLYRREIRTIGDALLDPVVSFVGFMQDAKREFGTIRIHSGGYQLPDEMVAFRDVEQRVGVGAEMLTELFLEMRAVLANSVMVRKNIGTFRVSEGVILCEPEREPPSRLLPDIPGWKKSPRLQRIVPPPEQAQLEE